MAVTVLSVKIALTQASILIISREVFAECGCSSCAYAPVCDALCPNSYPKYKAAHNR